MLISGTNNLSQIKNCLNAAHHFLLSRNEAMFIYRYQVGMIKESWDAVCDEAKLNEVDRQLLWGRQFLNPYAFEGL